MKTKILTLTLMLLCFLELHAQENLFNDSLTPGNGFNDIAASPGEEQIMVGTLSAGPHADPIVRIRCIGQQVLTIRVFTMTGDLAMEQTYVLEAGTNEISIGFSNLDNGNYMVQLYTTVGSTIRRFLKM